MQFRDFSQKLLGSKVKVSTITHLLTHEGAPVSEREISKMIDASPGAVNRTLKELHDCNLISQMRVGSATVWNVNKKSYAYWLLEGFASRVKQAPIYDLQILLRNYIRTGKESHSPDMAGSLPEGPNNLRFIKKGVLFGSIAEGRETSSSDIDLFILVENDRQRSRVSGAIGDMQKLAIQRYGNVLSANVMTIKEFNDPSSKSFLSAISRGTVVFEHENPPSRQI